jgi:hypothetical protein
VKNLDFKVNERSLTIAVCDEDREIYEILCVNKLHFYVICFMARKLKEGENVDMSFFQPLK